MVSYFGRSKTSQIESYLPPFLRFLEIDNKCILLSALKKAEEGNFIIIRIYNISSKSQNARLAFYEKILIENAEIVNFLEEKPKNNIKAEITNLTRNNLEIELKPHVIVTLKIKYEFME
ncbi:MAG: glycosyl hydrolase-related protein [Candidatus Hodarchaeota archaeon]